MPPPLPVLDGESKGGSSFLIGRQRRRLHDRHNFVTSNPIALKCIASATSDGRPNFCCFFVVFFPFYFLFFFSKLGDRFLLARVDRFSRTTGPAVGVAVTDWQTVLLMTSAPTNGASPFGPRLNRRPSHSRSSSSSFLLVDRDFSLLFFFWFLFVLFVCFFLRKRNRASFGRRGRPRRRGCCGVG